MPAEFELTISASTGAYDVRIGPGTFDELVREIPDAQVIADAFFAGRFPDVLPLEATEDHKTLGGVQGLIEALRDRGVTRGDVLVALGGGIVQDVATAVASLYMRGLPWSYAPTTLLAMADSCIGGKSSLNVGPYKNLAGNFHPPQVVVIDPAFIDTLPAEDRAGGLCEAMKISFCRGPEAFATYLELQAAFAEEPVQRAGALLHHVLRAKQWFVETDEFDQAERRLLNFGHTFGHALEGASGFAITHGIAVGIGVLCAERFAVGLDGDAIAQPALADHARELVGAAPNLGARLARVDVEQFERSFRSDKKHGRDGLHVILPTKAGTVAERVVPDEPATMRLVHESLAEAMRMVEAA